MSETAKQEGYALLGDIGGTNVRLVLARIGETGRAELGEAKVYHGAELSCLEDAVRDFLAVCQPKPRIAVLGVAGPVIEGVVKFTNRDWVVSVQSLRALGFAEVTLLNDFEALAYGVPHLQGPELLHLGGPQQGVADAAIAVLGAGTGFGVSGGFCSGPLARPLISEGGHCGFASGDDEEIELLRVLRRRFAHVSVERVLSGPGLLNLYLAMAAVHGAAAEEYSEPQALIEAGHAGQDLPRRTLERFTRIYGGVAGDFALTLGARGGVFLSGGVTRAVQSFLKAPAFRARFEDKGRLGAYLAAIPTQIILDDAAAYHGLSAVARAHLYDKR